MTDQLFAQTEPPVDERVAALSTLRDHWVTGYGCDKEPRHADRTRFHCYCGWSSGQCATVGDALEEYVQHVGALQLPQAAEGKHLVTVSRDDLERVLSEEGSHNARFNARDRLRLVLDRRPSQGGGHG